jgi:hypothetical protein
MKTSAVILMMGLVVVCACHEEPTIVIKFEPSDLAVAASPAPLVRASPSPSPSPRGIGLVRECKKTADCVVEPEDCCDCANGGKLHAIAKAQATASKAARAKRCRGVMCTMMLSLDPTCGKRADCVEGACVLVDKPKTK